MLVAALVVTPIGGWPAPAHALADPVAIAAGIGVGVTLVGDPVRVRPARDGPAAARSTYALFVVACCRRPRRVIGVIVLSQLPSLLDLTGIALVMLGVALHREARRDPHRLAAQSAHADCRTPKVRRAYLLGMLRRRCANRSSPATLTRAAAERAAAARQAARGDGPRGRGEGLRGRDRRRRGHASRASRAARSTSCSSPRRRAWRRPTGSATTCSRQRGQRGDAPMRRDWREELRLGIRAYLQHARRGAGVRPRLPARVAARSAREREPALRRFARRYGKSFARSGAPVPPDDALYVLAAGVHELACARVRAGQADDRPRRRAGGLRGAARRQGGAMDLTFNERELAFRDELRAWLADNHARRRARRRRGRALRLAARLPAAAGRRRLGGRALAARVRRPRRDADRVGDLLRGARPRAARRCRRTCSACCWPARRS